MTDEEEEQICETIQSICFVIDVIVVGLGLLMLCASW